MGGGYGEDYSGGVEGGEDGGGEDELALGEASGSVGRAAVLGEGGGLRGSAGS